MGIYIPGIETPKGHNYVTITIWPSSTASYGLFDREENLCDFKSIKAVPVPPHGRCIDADALFIPYDICDGEEAMEFIKAAPAIIPADGKGTDVPTREEGE